MAPVARRDPALPLTSNTLGQAYALTVLTPILPEAEDRLRATLATFKSDSSPLELRRTHFARWVVVNDFVNDPSQPTNDHLACHYLLFTATLDGELESYLDWLCATDWAADVWGACIGAPDPPQGPALKAYLEHNQIDTGLFFSAYPDARVEQVHRCLKVRADTIEFAAAAQEMDPQTLQREFLTRFPAS
jgi:hypothetical protein